jgi:release factor glutamine methyltransferase
LKNQISVERFSNLIVEKALLSAVKRFVEAGLRTPRLDAELLLAEALGGDRIKVYLQQQELISDGELKAFEAMVSRRLFHEPVQYILGRVEFYGITFKIGAGVLIPRSATETIIEAVVRDFPDREKEYKFAEVGLGSGCIGGVLLALYPRALLYASEISPFALEFAEKNLKNLGVRSRATISEKPFFDGLKEFAPFDAIVSNPPYVPERCRQTIMPEVAGWEPGEALFAGEDGFEVIGPLLEKSRHLLAAHGILFFEFGEGMAKEAERRAIAAGYSDVNFDLDLDWHERVLIARR